MDMGGNRVLSELMKIALDCVEEFTEMEVTISNGREIVTINNLDKIVWEMDKNKKGRVRPN